jgi:hypothetical protein
MYIARYIHIWNDNDLLLLKPWKEEIGNGGLFVNYLLLKLYLCQSYAYVHIFECIHIKWRKFVEVMKRNDTTETYVSGGNVQVKLQVTVRHRQDKTEGGKMLY